MTRLIELDSDSRSRIMSGTKNLSASNFTVYKNYKALELLEPTILPGVCLFILYTQARFTLLFLPGCVR